MNNSDGTGKTIGFIGLGRMGLNMAILLVEKGYRVVGYNRSEEARTAAKDVGVEVVADISSLVMALPSPKVVWVMVSSSAVDAVLDELTPLLSPGDTIIDGGNSFYQDSLRRHAALKAKELKFLDCGTSGGMDGARHGASIMVGGRPEVFAEHEHIFRALAAKDGYARVGNEGAGHFVKMIHNGIEYGMMGAIAEGITVLHEHEAQFGIKLEEVFKPYEHESIITSKLVSWLKKAYDEGQIDLITGEVPRGETESEMEHIVTLGEVKVLEAALVQRKATREKPSYLGKLVAAMRNQFGGHAVIKREVE
jgi:6-phosphogluconate dehydrogenase